MEGYHSPSEEQAAKLMQGNLDAPVAALNLFWFHERAQYQPEDPEFGTPAADVSGREAYATYAAEAGSKIAAIGGHVAFSTSVDQVMIGPDNLNCDIAAIMVFPTRSAFIQMMTAPEFQSLLGIVKLRLPITSCCILTVHRSQRRSNKEVA